MKWLLDTDTCIALIKQSPPKAIKRLSSKPVGQVGISALTLAELAFGVAKSSKPDRNREALEGFLLPLTVVPFDDLAARAYGPIRTALERGGTPIGAIDTLLAAQAVAADLVLVTHNQREFRRIEGLRLEDWLR